MWSTIKGFCLDISGVLMDSDGTAGNGAFSIDGSKEAVDKLLFNKIPFRLVTNESQITRDQLLQKLEKIGFTISPDIVFTPPGAMRTILTENNLRPHLLVHKDVRSEFSSLSSEHPNAVVVGDAGDFFSYEALNETFQLLMRHPQPKFFTLGRGRYYKQGVDSIMMDVGPFTAALEYATGLQAQVVGKPSELYYKTALKDLNLPAHSVAMIGDDIVSDVGGAQAVGMKGVQVRSGKFRPSDEPHPTVKPDLYVDNLKEAIDLFMAANNLS